LLEDEGRISLFIEIARVGLIKREVDEQVQQLLDRGLIKHDQHGIRLSERGWKVFEAIEALSFLDAV
jgi:predicted transcriptional regulator